MQDSLRHFKASIFQALANPTRIAIVELLRDGEKSASYLMEHLSVEQANASQHLAVLRAKHIVTSRKEGTTVLYSIRDPLLIDVLDIMRRYFEIHISEILGMLEEFKQEDRGISMMGRLSDKPVLASPSSKR